MVETLRFSRIGEQDLEIGTGTFEAELSDGRRVALNKINLASFSSSITNNGIFYADADGTLSQDTQFLFDDITNQQTIGTSGSLRIGSTGTADGQLHVAVDGASKLQLENTGSTVADVSLVFTKEGTDAWNLSLDDSNSDHLSISTGSTPSATPHLFFSSSDTSVVMGENVLNTFNTSGLTIQAGTTASEMLSAKETANPHGVTDRAETDTFLRIGRSSGASGAAFIEGFGTSINAVILQGVSTTANTQEDTAASAPIRLGALLKSGTTVTAFAAADNILVIHNNGTTRAIFKGDGDLELDGVATDNSFDDHDDIKLLEAYKCVGNPDYKQTLGSWVDGHLDTLEEGGVISRYNDNGREGYFISTKGIRGLLVDAVRQLAGRVTALEANAEFKGTSPITGL